MLKKSAIVLAGAAAIAAMSAPTPVRAQEFPTKPIRFVVPYPPGGASDVTARLIGQKLTEAWGQQVVVDNRREPTASLPRSSWLKRLPTDTRS